jgi:hypothetical protein
MLEIHKDVTDLIDAKQSDTRARPRSKSYLVPVPVPVPGSGKFIWPF